MVIFSFHDSIIHKKEKKIPFHNSVMGKILLWVDKKSEILEG